MGQQEETTIAAGNSALRRTILAFLVAALMALTMTASAVPAFAAGQGIGTPKGGQGDESVSTNPGNFVNDQHGDQNNDVSNIRSFLKRDGRQGPGVGNN